MGRKLILTSQGLNTRIGRTLIKREISREDLASKKIMLIFEPYFSIERILIEAAKWMGFNEENIYLFHQGLAKDIIVKMDYIYVTEGNTFDILKGMRDANIMDSIRKAYLNGTVYIGASAGAVIAGINVEVAREFDSLYNRDYDYGGLGLVNGIVIPHQSKESIKANFSPYAIEQLKKFDNVYTIDDEGILVL